MTEEVDVRWTEVLERQLFAVYRVTLLLVVTLALGGTLAAGIHWFYAQLAYRASLPGDYLAPPVWEEVQPGVLPATAEDAAAGAAEPEAPLVAPQVQEIHALLAKQFDRNKDGARQFRQLLPQRYLQEVLAKQVGAPAGWDAIYRDSLMDFAASLAEDGRINRIASLEARAETLLAAIEEFNRQYRQRLASAQISAMEHNAQAKASHAAADAALRGILPVLALVTVLGLLLVCVRIELHLRQMAADRKAAAGRK